MPPNPPSKAHGFAMRSMSLRDMQISKSEKKICLPPPKSWLRPCAVYMKGNGSRLCLIVLYIHNCCGCVTCALAAQMSEENLRDKYLAYIIDR